MMKKIVILGSTGSIGQNALSVIREEREKFQVKGLSARSNIDLLEKQIEEFHPETVVITDKEAGERFLSRSLAKKIKVILGKEGLLELVRKPEVDLVIIALVGIVGLLPTLEAICAKKTIALATKEVMVSAGAIVTENARKNNVEILPVDSEHNSIFQALRGHCSSEIKRIILTASGGPLAKIKGDLSDITPSIALKHPVWKMGKKISIDSATLMNKGLEVIEAHHLFGVEPAFIEVVIHREAIIHSLVEFKDGFISAILAFPDMRLPLHYILHYPGRVESSLPKLDFSKIERLNFKKPDFDRFPCLKYAYDALYKEGTMPAVLNRANEVAVDAFLKKKIKFGKIPEIIKRTMDLHQVVKDPTLEDILVADRWAKEKAQRFM
ncbi:MAG: 1-deoxy-D-xylulose-5-phosphate reductoisomerase [Candidatus Omnitrophica bacterium]|nr:1-deoxy-D-xylulose-5-phosphate reductoisomerase [Candidatus Omnitrophota bacterium]